MASPGIKISSLPAIGTPTGAEILAAVQGGITSRTTVDEILQAGLVITASYIVVGGAPSTYSGKLRIKGAGASSATYNTVIYDSSDQGIFFFNDNGRIDQYSYTTDGAIHVLGVKPVTPANDQRMGHYAFTAQDSSNGQHTLAAVEAYVTDITRASLDSSISLKYADSVDGSGGGYTYSQPNKEVKISKAGVVIPDINFVLGTSTGTKLGTATSQKLGLWNATPVVQPTAVADASGGGTVDAEARTALNALLARMRTIGAIAT